MKHSMESTDCTNSYVLCLLKKSILGVDYPPICNWTMDVLWIAAGCCGRVCFFGFFKYIIWGIFAYYKECGEMTEIEGSE